MTPPPLHPAVQEHWSQILEAFEDHGVGVVVVADRHGELERWYANRTARALIGMADGDDEIPVLSPIVPEERDRVESRRASKLAGLDVPATYETVVQRPDGTRVPVEVTDRHVPIAGGYVAVSFLRDMSECQAMQGGMLEAERMAIVGAIAAGVAHEINNPLTYVLLHLRSLRRALPKWNLEAKIAADVERLLAEAEGGADRVRVIVRDLLALARGQGSIDDSIDVAAVLDGAVRLLAPSMQHRVRIVREGDRVPPVQGDETRLAHAALAMLLFASAGFSSDDPSQNLITVCVDSDGGAVRIEVRDNGQALDADQMARAFEPFYAPRGGGASASLAVARAVATGLGGSVELERCPGGGSLTRMTLPASVRRRY